MKEHNRKACANFCYIAMLRTNENGQISKARKKTHEIAAWKAIKRMMEKRTKCELYNFSAEILALNHIKDTNASALHCEILPLHWQ